MEQGGEYSIEYTNELARYRRMDDGVAIMRSIEQLGALAQVAGPDVLARVDFDQAAKVMLEVSGVPARVIRGDDEVQALMEQRQEQQAQEMQAQQQQQILAAAPVAASAAKDLAQAQVLAATAEQGPMPGVLPG